MSAQENKGSGHTRRARKKGEESPMVALSKSLSWLLRHHLDTSGLEVRSDGYVRLDQLVRLLSHGSAYRQLRLPKFNQYTLSQIHEVVNTNDKKRFTITTLETPDGPKEHIRANQGHTLKQIQVDMEPITSAADHPTIIHGTHRGAWALIAQDPKGLSRMKRNHIHFATGLLGEEKVISGMRFNCTVLIYVDLEKALEDGVKFWKSENGVVLTEGEKGEGSLSKEYFKKVVTNKGEILWPLHP